MGNRRKKYMLVFLAGVFVSLAAQAGADLGSSYLYRKNGGTSPESAAANQKIEVICDLIDEEFLFEKDEYELTEGMYAGLVSGLEDPYSEYYTAEEYLSVSQTHEGHYKGIGVVMIQEKNTGIISVGHCYEESPAKKAGVLEGDIFYKVDGETIDGMELSDVATAIKNNGRDDVVITIYREKTQEYIDIKIIKEEIEIPVVEHEMMESNIGYIAIYQFTAVTATQFETAYQELLNSGMKRLIVDLRDNPGGLLSGVVDTLNCIMPEGLLVYTEDKEGNREEYFSKGETPIEIPLVVLINENSASASEIFAGAVKDHEVGTLVGVTTFGKGIVQKTFGLNDGSVVKLTVSSYFTPNGVNIHGTGVEPDITVELPEDGKEDTQLQRAVEELTE